jgi:hypothetical protein
MRAGHDSDKYFVRAREILLADGFRPRVTMQVFGKSSAFLGGVDEAIAILKLCAMESRPRRRRRSCSSRLATITGWSRRATGTRRTSPAPSACPPTRRRPGGEAKAWERSPSHFDGRYDFTADVVLLEGRPCAKAGREYRPKSATRAGGVNCGER